MRLGAPILLAVRQMPFRTSSSALVAHATMWNASAHKVAFAHRSATTVAIHSALGIECMVDRVGTVARMKPCPRCPDEESRA